MEVEAGFVHGSKGALVAILRSLKDLNRSNTLSLRFSHENGLHSHFSCGPGGDAKAAFASFRLFQDSSDANSRPSSASPPGNGANGAPKRAETPTSERGSQLDRFPPSHPFSFMSLGSSQLSSLFSGLTCNPEIVNTDDDGLVVTLSVHPKTMFHQMELVDEFDRVSLRSEKAEAGCELYFESPDLGRKVLYEMDFVPGKIDPVIHRLPSPPTSGYAFVVQIEAKEYIRTIAALHDASDLVNITGLKNSVMFESSGPNGTLQVGLSQKYNLPNTLVPRVKILHFASPGIKQSFNTRYLLAFAHAVHLGTSVILSFPPNPSGPLLATMAQQPGSSRAVSPHHAPAAQGSSRPESPHQGHHSVSPLRPANSHLRISHPIEVVHVQDALGVGMQNAQHGVVKLASAALAACSAAHGTAGKAFVEERDAVLEGKKVVGFLEYFLAPEMD
ncbi:hypothetical protein HDU98_001067 [Podochytrium sp. JEL0797]|nr:hypothetical protein HDU98_001067 [Podochytrium sp. JEL0797]